jgi:hypothetical protein
MPGAPPWTPAEDDRLLALLIESGSYERAAHRLGRGAEACRSRARVLRQKARPALGGETRQCLSCRKPFPKERGIFLCTSCKSTEAWRTAA